MCAIGVIRIYLYFLVHALDTETLGLDEDASAAAANLQALFHYWRAAEILTDVSLGRLYLLLYLGVLVAASDQRAKLHRTIWRVANDLRGSVDGWDFKALGLSSLL